MKLNAILLLFIFILGIQKSTYAETWNEPWQKDILKNADFFVLANVISNEEDVGTTIEILKHFGNQSLSREVLINGFSLLDIRSSSGHGVHLDRKSTRLNSSHVRISYAVFCLKKKKKKKEDNKVKKKCKI